MIDGKEIPVDWCKGLGDEAVYLSPLNTDIAAEGTQEAIDKAKEELISGERHVFAGPLKGTSPEGETIEVAEGEYFHEQEEASAPVMVLYHRRMQCGRIVYRQKFRIRESIGGESERNAPVCTLQKIL